MARYLPDLSTRLPEQPIHVFGKEYPEITRCRRRDMIVVDVQNLSVSHCIACLCITEKIRHFCQARIGVPFNDFRKCRRWITNECITDGARNVAEFSSPQSDAQRRRINHLRVRRQDQNTKARLFQHLQRCIETGLHLDARLCHFLRIACQTWLRLRYCKSFFATNSLATVRRSRRLQGHFSSSFGIASSTRRLNSAQYFEVAGTFDS